MTKRPKTYTKSRISHDIKNKCSDKYDYSTVDYKGLTKPITLKCNKHGEFDITPNEFLYQSKGCPKCDQINTLKEFVRQASEKHDYKFGYNLSDKFDNLNSVLNITCPVHGAIQYEAHKHLYSDSGCYKCSKRSIAHTEEYIRRAKLKHGDKFDYSLTEYTGSYEKVKIKCKKHGKFSLLASRHLFGQGCPKCTKEKRKNEVILTQDEIIRRGKEIHGNKYDYSLVEYSGSAVKVKIICPEHGIFTSTPNNHMGYRKSGCPKCKGRKLHADRALTTEEFVRRSKEKWGDKFDYSKTVYINFKTKLDVICKKHGVRSVLPQQHLKNDCKECYLESLKNKINKNEK